MLCLKANISNFEKNEKNYLTSYFLNGKNKSVVFTLSK
ncbi:MAG: hypothetical protein PG977_000883 [Bartonella clarridgeiae]|nr:MAG: hypothetical protein PG977_000883 [Bartonella clarridgeiae]